LQQLKGEGLSPYYIPVGGSSALGVWGYLQAIEELRQQTEELGLSFDVIASVSAQRGIHAAFDLVWSPAAAAHQG
jgi:1-aminocyclopropane-1-carboxylate deaminase/D-cysteine desulfhydrase-like pyridoxal-dependent ACC family enzyme